jgi:L-rhamnose mutarotase
MKNLLRRVVALAVPMLFGIAIGIAWSQSLPERSVRAEAAEATQAKAEKVQRFGAVIGLRPEKKDYYLELHANTWPSVLEQIRKSNIRDYSIYLAELDGKLYLFATYKYTGDDFKADMKKMAEDPETQRWWKQTDPCQIRLPGTPDGEWWKPIPEVFRTD